MPDLDLNFNRYFAPVLVRRLYVVMLALLAFVGVGALIVGAFRFATDVAGVSRVDADAIQKCVDEVQGEGPLADRIGTDSDPRVRKSICQKREARARLAVDFGETLSALVGCLLLGVVGRILLEVAIVQFRISESLDRLARREGAP